MKQTVICQKLDHFGRGIVYQNNKITFIENLLPGEKAEIEITVNKKNYAEGKIINLLEKSKFRIKSNCPYQNCGCHLKHLDYQSQLKFKIQKLNEIIQKFAKIEVQINPIVFSNNINHYRNKITLKVDKKIGYYQNKSNKLIPITSCQIATEKTNKIIKILNGINLNKVSETTIKDFNQTMIIIKGSLDIEPLKPLVDTIYQNNILVYGKPYITSQIKDLNFQISKDSFFQTNRYLTEKLYDTAINYCGKDKTKKVLDLYCGTGTITLLLSKNFKEVTGIEINKEAIDCAVKNKELNNINNVNFICGDVSQKTNNLNADIILVDPPRSGLDKKGIADIIKINPEKLIYISCDPVTLARDLNILKENYNIKEITPIDMFPNTYHVECVCLLERRLALIK